MKNLYIIKIGGNIIDDEAKLSAFLEKFAAIDGAKILVHGGGKLATRVAEAMNIPQQMIDGRRITDAETLKVVTMVYAGSINKNIVAALQQKGCNAMGLSGADGNIIQAHKRIHPVTDYGFVGDVDAVNAALINVLLQQNISLVFAPITHDGNGLLLNTNADTVAQELAKAVSALFNVSLFYCFEKDGVLQDAGNDESVIPTINLASFLQMKKDGIISEGMIPKLQNAFAALDAGVAAVSIGHADKLDLLIKKESGTLIQHD
ncbi:MAG: acetylglutamate kinase [Sphingobacteriales bacterium]|nr:MAG: acetylglutamate kinase [Sphingobacteriales bacterium]